MIDSERLEQFLADVRYDFVVPPHKAYGTMTKGEAKKAFEWFVSSIPDRMDYFRPRCAADLGISVDELDYSHKSLILVWRWFIQTARYRPTPDDMMKLMLKHAKIRGEEAIRRQVFSVATEMIQRDIAIYFGECFRHSGDELYWDYVKKPKDDVVIHQPIIAGLYSGKLINGEFIPNKDGPKETRIGRIAPIHLVGVQAVRLYDGRESEMDLYDVFQNKSVHIPNYQVTPRLPIEQDLKPKARRIQGRYCYGYQDARLVLEQCKNTGRKVSHLYAVWPIENYTFRPDREHCYDYTGLSADQSWEHALQDLEQVKDDGHLFRIWYD